MSNISPNRTSQANLDSNSFVLGDLGGTMAGLLLLGLAQRLRCFQRRNPRTSMANLNPMVSWIPSSFGLLHNSQLGAACIFPKET